MNEYIVKFGNMYFEAEKSYKNQMGYLDKNHPENTAVLTKFDFKAKPFETKEEALKIAKKYKMDFEIIEIHKEIQVKDVEYYRSEQALADAIREEIKNYGYEPLQKMLKISESTFYKLLNGKADSVYERITINVCQELVKLGHEGLRMYITKRREWIAKKVKERAKMNELSSC
jgi:hypothetical protein|nr:MAG TPA: ATP-dependent target DNA activator B [Caudoviricetes sp.]